MFYLIFVVVGTGAGPALILAGPLVAGQLLLTRRLLKGEADTTGAREPMTRLLLWPTATVLAAQWLLFPVAAAGATGYDTTCGLVSLMLPPLYFLPLAVTRRREMPLRVAFTTGLLFSPLPVVFALAPHTGMGLVIGSRALLYASWGLVVAAIGILAYAAGYRLVATERECGERVI